MLLYLYMAAQTLTRGHSITKHTSLLLMHNSKSNTEEKSGLHDLQPQGTRSRKKLKCLSFIFEKKKTQQKNDSLNHHLWGLDHETNWED